LGAPRAIQASLAPKSATAPIAMSLAEQNGGIPTLMAALVIATGIFGAVTVTPLMNALASAITPRAVSPPGSRRQAFVPFRVSERGWACGRGTRPVMVNTKLCSHPAAAVAVHWRKRQNRWPFQVLTGEYG